VISEGGAQAFQSNSAVNGLLQNSCIQKAKPQHLKPTPCFSTDNDGHLGIKKQKRKNILQQVNAIKDIQILLRKHSKANCSYFAKHVF